MRSCASELALHILGLGVESADARLGPHNGAVLLGRELRKGSVSKLGMYMLAVIDVGPQSPHRAFNMHPTCETPLSKGTDAVTQSAVEFARYSNGCARTARTCQDGSRGCY